MKTLTANEINEINGGIGIFIRLAVEAVRRYGAKKAAKEFAGGAASGATGALGGSLAGDD